MENSSQFLESYNAIDKQLRRKFGINKSEGFYAVVDIASRSDAGVRRLAIDLKEFADLRNAIVHERTDGHVIADPNDIAVYEIRKLADLLTEPPKALASATRQVLALKPSQSIAEALTVMLKKSFSQIPIYDYSFVGLLTSNTIARWLGSLVKDEIFSVIDTQIQNVLAYTEYRDPCVFLSRQANVFEAIDMFSQMEQRGRRLEAIIITESGHSGQTPLGIITQYDLPRMLETTNYRLRR